MNCKQIEKHLKKETGTEVSVSQSSRGYLKFVFVAGGKLTVLGKSIYPRHVNLQYLTEIATWIKTLAEPIVHDVEVGMLMTDNQDGGYTIRMFPTYEEARQAKRERIADKLNKQPHEVTEVQMDDYDYECGYLDRDVLKIQVVDGIPKLVKEVYFGVGQ